jgi:hypothetical protein
MDASQEAFCSDPAHFCRPTRREILRVGAVGSLGLTLGDCLRLQAQSPTTRPADTQPAGAKTPPAESVILIFLEGGMSQLDSFDPKPNAPIEIRGEFGAIDTKADGVQISGLWRQTAGVADKIAFIRSMTHGEAAHERGCHNMLTGYRPSPAITYPSMGAVIAHEYGPRRDLPAYIAVPNADGGSGFAGTGYLSSACGAFSVGGEPNDGNFVVRDLNLPPGVDETRMERRKGLLAAVDEHFRKLESSDQIVAMDSFYGRAYSLISSKSAREAFDINAEPKAVREAYGRNAFGQRVLLARRLVAAGARFVTVFFGGWDMHVDVHGGMRGIAPLVDQGLAALIRDLDQHGLLGKTLLMLTTEFGRTSRINKDRGRDHWPKVFSVAFAGGGIKGGQAIGTSNAYATEPQDNPVSPADMSASVFHQLGIDYTKKLLSPGDRPINLVRDGQPITKLA